MRGSLGIRLRAVVTGLWRVGPHDPLHISPCIRLPPFGADIIKTSQAIFYTLRVAVPRSQPSVAVGSLSMHRISGLTKHVNDSLFDQAA